MPPCLLKTRRLSKGEDLWNLDWIQIHSEFKKSVVYSGLSISKFTHYSDVKYDI